MDLQDSTTPAADALAILDGNPDLAVQVLEVRKRADELLDVAVKALQKYI